jgi:hypothetical protein
MPTLPLKAHLFGPDDDTDAMTRLPLILYESKPHPEAFLIFPENSAVTVMVLYPLQPESWTVS